MAHSYRRFFVSCLALIAVVAAAWSRCFSPIAHFVAGAWRDAFPLVVPRELDRTPGLTASAGLAGIQTSRRRSFVARLLQREPLQLSAGTGMRLAA
jgi:hypothetical protein